MEARVNALKALLYCKFFNQAEEGLRLEVYQHEDDVPTIGFGHTQTAADLKKITRKKADELFEQDFADAHNDARKIPEYSVCDDVRKLVLISMVFQMGLPSVMKFEKTRAFIKKKQWAKAAEEMLDSKWAAEDSPERAAVVAAAMETGSILDMPIDEVNGFSDKEKAARVLEVNQLILT